MDEDVARLSNEHTARALDGTRYLTFQVAHEQYGLEILAVQEITCSSTITPLPGTPPYLRGIVDLGGITIPVIDLRSTGWMDAEPDPFTVIIVVNVGGRVMGIIVDSVSDVLNVPVVHRPATPDIAWAVDARYISGIGKAGEKLIRVLDVDRLIDATEALTAIPA